MNRRYEHVKNADKGSSASRCTGTLVKISICVHACEKLVEAWKYAPFLPQKKKPINTMRTSKYQMKISFECFNEHLSSWKVTHSKKKFYRSIWVNADRFHWSFHSEVAIHETNILTFQFQTSLINAIYTNGKSSKTKLSKPNKNFFELLTRSWNIEDLLTIEYF